MTTLLLWLLDNNLNLPFLLTSAAASANKRRKLEMEGEEMGDAAMSDNGDD